MANPPLPQLLRDRMRKRGYTPATLPDALDLSRQTTSYLLNGKVRITAKTAPRIARVLGETAQYWLRKQIDADFQEGM